MFDTAPATPNCRRLFEDGHHLMIGISPFNSRFSEEYVSGLISWGSATADRVDVLLAGDETSHLLEATGTPPGRARRKSREAISRNRRITERSLRDLGLQHRISVYHISDFYECETYRAIRRDADKEFRVDPSFRQACIDMSRKAVIGRLRGIGSEKTHVSDRQAEIATGYVLAELPLFLNTPDVLNVPRSLLVYHQPWELGTRISSGEFSISMSKNQGYLVVTESAALEQSAVPA